VVVVSVLHPHAEDRLIAAQQLRINELVAELAAQKELVESLTQRVLYEGHRADHNWHLFADLATKVMDRPR
jgi:hypothetical protein